MSDIRNRTVATPVSLFCSGVMDGLLLGFAIAWGLWYAGKPAPFIINTIPLVIIPVAFIMAIGSYAARKGNEKNTPEKEEAEWNRTRRLLTDWGMNPEEQIKARAAWMREMKEWDEVMENADDKPVFILTEPLLLFTAIMTGGALPLLIYTLPIEPLTKIALLIIVTLLMLFLVGYLTDKYNHLPPLRGARRAIGYGIAAGLISLLLAMLLS